jgi:hypothetical protein
VNWMHVRGEVRGEYRVFVPKRGSNVISARSFGKKIGSVLGE